MHSIHISAFFIWPLNHKSVSYSRICVIRCSIWQPSVIRCDGFMINFSYVCILGQEAFRSTVLFSMFLGYLSFRRFGLSVRNLSAICPFYHFSSGHMSIRTNGFLSYVLSVICPFGHFYFGHQSYRHHRLLLVLPLMSKKVWTKHLREGNKNYAEVSDFSRLPFWFTKRGTYLVLIQ